MLRITQLKLPIEHTEEELRLAAARMLCIDQADINSLHIIKRSIDARKKPHLFYVYQLDADVKTADRIVMKKCGGKNVDFSKKSSYRFPTLGNRKLKDRPVIIGCGPAGLFAAYMLAKQGYRPIVLERGRKADKRKTDIDTFWKDGILNPESNVQFGEGGAGTFSDGKLNTLVKDKEGRGRLVFELFVEAGAPPDILYEQKPHIGTDLLIRVITNLRHMTEELGGEFRFESKVTKLLTENGRIQGVVVNENETVISETVILAIGHSARDTYEMLSKTSLHMESKSFAVGVRVEHPQSLIDEGQYGRSCPALGAASYKLTYTDETKRGVYSFCMCPGGYVVNASSEKERLVVNGMSYHARNSGKANSAIVTSVTPTDYLSYRRDGEHDALSGIRFLQDIEGRAFKIRAGAIPVQRFGDFKTNRASTSLGHITPCIKGRYELSNIRTILPDYISEPIIRGIEHFGSKIKGFNDEDALLLAPETRTSSPIRITRNEAFEGSLIGLYPCGEGAGYAGGITSAAMDGIKVAEAIASVYHP